MGLQGVIAQAAKTAFNAIGDLKVIATYTRVGTETYNTDTGVISSSNTTSTVSGFYENFNKSEIDGEKVIVGDAKILILVSAIAFEPKEGDKVSFGGINWLIKRHWKDPSQTLYQLHLRMI